ncbi:hypothetical protein BDZ45DRAFT_755100 [Acephala macrosclerotiorum]|nr:hypothetical protein BDZ45DRAFT_755100 [Acephala macrosclerotiorum]
MSIDGPSDASKKRVLESPTSEESTAKKARHEGDEAVPSFYEIMGLDMVDIIVGKGENGRQYRVYEKKASLPGDDPKSFDLLLAWVYTGKLHAFKWVPDGATFKANWELLSLYKLADKLFLSSLMDEITTVRDIKFGSKCHFTPNPKTFTLKYFNFPVYKF